MNPKVSAIIIILLITGAILYSGSAVLGMGFGPNPLMAGALAAKPNGVPTCLTACGPENETAEQAENESPANEAAENHHINQVVTHQTVVTQHTAVAHNGATSAHAASTARAAAATQGGAQAAASAKASATVVVHPRTVVVQRHTTVVRPKTTVVQRRTVVVQHPQVAAADTDDTAVQAASARTVTTVQTQPVAVTQTQPVVVQRTVALPATGNAALNTSLGLGSMLTAGFYYLRARRRPRPGATS